MDTGYIKSITNQDVSDALNAAAAVGDDWIQRETQGQVNSETWTHGSSPERQQWFRAAYASADPRGCDTFAAQILTGRVCDVVASLRREVPAPPRAARETWVCTNPRRTSRGTAASRNRASGT
ncbi:MAG: neutral zinc metallopeptidase [Actinomycetota bacterium]|nr:neutral zinc metallopeptidase [Actinomycetota bacterium]